MLHYIGMTAEHRTLELAGHRIDCALIRPVKRPDTQWCDTRLILLHEGLGCIALWRDFPQRLADALDEPVLAYSRYGYGQSDVLEGPRAVDYMQSEARKPLRDLIERLGISNPVLVGHSDGGSIALLYAGYYPDDVAGVVALAPHLFVEEFGLVSIRLAALDFERSDLRERLRRYHRDPVRTFKGWSDIWLHPAFRAWNIEAEVGNSRCPLLAIQGRQDQYGSLRQIERIGELRPGTELAMLENCRHSPHLEHPAQVLAALKGFWGRMPLA